MTERRFPDADERAHIIARRNQLHRDLIEYMVTRSPNEQEARAQLCDIRVATMPMSYVARALEVDESRGFMKAVVDAQSKQILGFTVLGLEGGELMAVVETAMLGKLPYTVLQDAVFAHPTIAESLNNLFATLV